MKISYIKICVVNITLLVLALLNIFIFNIENLYIIAAVLIIYTVIVKLMIGYEKSRSRFIRDVMMTLFIYIMLYHILTYVGGVFIGFLRSSYNLSFLGIIRNVIPLLIVIIAIELLRYMLIKKSSGNNYLLVFTTLVFIIIDLLLISKLYSAASLKDMVSLIALSIIPSISKNIFLSYLSYKHSYVPSIFYRILMELIVFVVPIFPDFNEYVTAVLYFVVPIIIMAIVMTTYRKKEKQIESTLKKRYVSKISVVVLVLVMIVTVILTSGMFKYYVLSIGSGSMKPTLNVGDVVVVEKYNEDDYADINIGDVLIFTMSNKTVVHRVVEINEINSSYTFITKGDNNDENDNWIVLEENIIGVAKLNIKYIGLPTIWLNNLIN